MKKLVIGAAAAITFALGAVAYAQESQPKGYMIANYEIKDQATYQKYMDAAVPLGPKYNVKIIVFNLKSTGVEGSPKSVMAIAEFPSLADAQRFYNSPEYAEARKFRIAATEGSVVITEGFVPPKQ